MNFASYTWGLWYNIVCWPVVGAPQFHRGQIATLVTGFAGIGFAAAIAICSRRWPGPTLTAEEWNEQHAARTPEDFDGKVGESHEKELGVPMAMPVPLGA